MTSKVTSKRQVTIPKGLADRFGIEAGDEIGWMPSGSEIRVIFSHQTSIPDLTPEERLGLFDEATLRRDSRQVVRATQEGEVERGWARDDLYGRGRRGAEEGAGP
jgi:bifunctional DNA-binding transcriptional regulator/antitoxin component of YhaV-PrlF toxin-antitoxin module